MASFSTTHPFAYHAFPLSAARSIWTSGALLGKDDRGSAGQARRTVADTDRRLGFSRYVHLYLPRRGTTPAALPILAAQLQPARDPACPHALLVVPTANLADADCSLCNWTVLLTLGLGGARPRAGPHVRRRRLSGERRPDRPDRGLALHHRRRDHRRILPPPRISGCHPRRCGSC